MVYKYAAPTGIKYMLEDKTLCFTSLQHLNDVNEAMPNIEEIVKEQTGDFFGKVQSTLTLLPSSPLNGLSPAQLRSYLDKVGLTQDAHQTAGQRTGWQIARQKFAHFGVLSLTTDPTNLLMWGHYTGNGAGLVLGLDPAASVFRDSAYGGISGIHKVTYSTKRATFDESTLGARLMAAVLTKSDHWRYEDERRCFREVASGQKNTIVPFEPITVKEIILGPQMALADVERCYELQRTTFPHATLKLAAPSPSTFVMDLRPTLPKAYLPLLWPDRTPATPLKIPPI